VKGLPIVVEGLSVVGSYPVDVAEIVQGVRQFEILPKTLVQLACPAEDGDALFELLASLAYVSKALVGLAKYDILIMSVVAGDDPIVRGLGSIESAGLMVNDALKQQALPNREVAL